MKINDQIRKMLIDYIIVQPNDTKIPPELELCKRFGVSRTTINRVITALVNDNYLYRERPLGTFTKKKVSKTRRVGIFFDPNAHVLSRIVELLSRQLDHSMYILEFLPLTLLNPSASAEERKDSLRKIADKKLDVIVCYGQRWFPYKELEQIHNSFGQIVFLSLYQGKNIIPGTNRIVFDSYMVGELAAEHLIEKGVNKFVFITFDLMPESKIEFYDCSFPHYDMKIFEGFKNTLKAAHKNIENLPIVNISSDMNSADLDMITPHVVEGCGFFALGDIRAKVLYNVANRKGLKIGKNISIVGLFNTDWTEVFHPTLTSIDINIEETVVQLNKVIKKNSHNLNIIVKPKLVKRES